MSLTIQSGGSLTIQGGGGGGGGGGATVGTYASRPAAGNAGAIYICTDSPIAQWVDDGSAWRPLIQGQALGTQVPAASAFTAFNSESKTTLADVGGCLRIDLASGTTSAAAHGGAIEYSHASAYVQGITSGAGVASSNVSGVIMLRHGASGNGIGFTTVTRAENVPVPNLWYVTIFANNALSTYYGQFAPMVNAPTCGRVRRSGSDLVVSVSRDLVSWTDIYTVAAWSVFGASAPDQVAVSASTSGGATGAVDVLSFKYGSL